MMDFLYTTVKLTEIVKHRYKPAYSCTYKICTYKFCINKYLHTWLYTNTVTAQHANSRIANLFISTVSSKVFSQIRQYVSLLKSTLVEQNCWPFSALQYYYYLLYPTLNCLQIIIPQHVINSFQFIFIAVFLFLNIYMIGNS